MWVSNIITTIDIWSSKIRTIIWYFDSDSQEDFHILGVWVSDSNAIRKGNILDMEEPSLFKDESEQATSIDKVFEKVISIYDEEYLNAIYNILLLMDKKEGKPEILTNFCDGLYNISIPLHSTIQYWIQTNLTC